MKIWITGVNGLIGSHLAQSLIDQGHEVWGNDNFLCSDKADLNPLIKYPMQGIEPMSVDCRDFEMMKHCLGIAKPDILVHTAATASEGFSVFSPSFITQNIYEASVATFSAAIASGVNRIVTMSSMSRYGKGKVEHETGFDTGVTPFHEHFIPSPVDPYGIAKVAAEDTLKTLCEAHDVKWSILVPHNCVGVGQEITPYRNVITIFLNRLKLGLPVYIYGDGEQKRCFSPIKDCIPSIINAVFGHGDGEVINIGPDNGEITINQALELCEEATGIKAQRIYLPPRPLTDDVKEAYCSSDKARKLLGYKEEQPLVECIKEMAAAIKPKPFNYGFPIEIMSENIPVTWSDKL